MIRISLPSAFSFCRLDVEPGTLIISPKVTMMVSFWRERAMARSISPLGVTQTGQPGPEINRMCSGRTPLIPYRKIETVCVPQTSINWMGRVEVFWILWIKPSAISLSRNSSTNFISLLPSLSKDLKFPQLPFHQLFESQSLYG